MVKEQTNEHIHISKKPIIIHDVGLGLEVAVSSIVTAGNAAFVVYASTLKL